MSQPADKRPADEGAAASDPRPAKKARDAPAEVTIDRPGGRRYTGQVNEQGRPHGSGTEYHADGSEWSSASWRDGQLQGRGSIIWRDGLRFEGDFVDGVRSGLGQYIWPDKRCYEGEIAAGRCAGLGIMWDPYGNLDECGRWANTKLIESCAVPRSKIPIGKHLSAAAKLAALLLNGGFYCGRLDNDGKLPHGQGSLHRAYGSEAIRGEWTGGRLVVSGDRDAEGQLHGAGSEWSVIGLYSGAFERGQRQGLGSMTFLDGGVFEGEWAADQRSGLGIEWNKYGHVVRCGSWSNNKLVESRPVPRSKIPVGAKISAEVRAALPHRTLLLSCGHYIGDFNTEFRQHGEGVHYRTDGSEWASGQWRDGKQHGRGKVAYPNGISYEGEFVDGLRCGQGKHRTDCYVYVGRFVRGQRSGMGKCTWEASGEVYKWAASGEMYEWAASGEVYEGEWVLNKRSGLGFGWSRNGEVLRYGRWADNKLVEPLPVLLSKIPVDGKQFLPAADRKRTLLLPPPDGGYYCGEINASHQPDGLGAAWRSDGELQQCSRWTDGKLAQATAVPLRLIPAAVVAGKIYAGADLLFPDGRFYDGDFNTQLQRHGYGSMYSADGAQLQGQSGNWRNDTLQDSPPVAAAVVPLLLPVPLLAPDPDAMHDSAAAAAAAPALPQRGHRKALLIGNNAYEPPVKPLHCCHNDAEDMRDALTELGFECTLLLDATRRQMTDGIRDFLASLQPHDIVFIHFSGHGQESAGHTYLLPKDFGRGQLSVDAVCLENVQHDLNAKNCHLINIIMLDCCRYDSADNTFRGTSSRAVASPRGDEGFARKPTSGQFLVAYSSDRGTVAHESRADRNGWFTGCVLKHLDTPGVLVEQIFKLANKDLMAKSQQKQRSWIHLTMVDDVTLRPR